MTDWNDHTITVCFSVGEKKFIYPDAFSKFLILKNNTMQGEIQRLLDEQEAEKRAERQALQEQQDRKNLLRNLKISPQSQAVFHIGAEERDQLDEDKAGEQLTMGNF